MAKKITKERLRYEGSRDIPNPFPKVESEDRKEHLMHWLDSGMVTLEDAACILQGGDPDKLRDKLSNAGGGKYNRTYGWFCSEYDSKQLQTSSFTQDGKPLFSPGVLIRHMWDQHRTFPLIVWAIYDEITSGDECKEDGLTKYESDKNYLKAALIVWDFIPKATKTVVIEILQGLPSKILDQKGGRIFLHAADATLNKLLKGKSSRAVGRAKNKDGNIEATTKVDITNEIVRIFKKEMADKSDL